MLLFCFACLAALAMIAWALDLPRLALAIAIAVCVPLGAAAAGCAPCAPCVPDPDPFRCTTNADCPAPTSPCVQVACRQGGTCDYQWIDPSCYCTSDDDCGSGTCNTSGICEA